MARVELRCIMRCPGLKSSYQEKGLLLMSNIATITSYQLMFNSSNEMG